jgi:hypothetical protein
MSPLKPRPTQPVYEKASNKVIGVTPRLPASPNIGPAGSLRVIGPDSELFHLWIYTAAEVWSALKRTDRHE